MEDYTADFISTLTMNQNPFIRLNGELYFLPICLDCHIYRINQDFCKLSKYMTYSFEEHDVHKENLEGRFGDMKLCSPTKTIVKKYNRT